MRREQLASKARVTLWRTSPTLLRLAPAQEVKEAAESVLDAILPQVTTVEEWEALPTGAVAVEADGTPHVKDDTPSSDVLISWLTKPLTVVWLP